MCRGCHTSLYNRRTLAGLVDYVVLPTLLLLLSQRIIALAGVRLSPATSGHLTASAGGLSRSTAMGWGLEVELATVAAGCLFTLLKDWLRQGQSPGKRLLGLRVVDASVGRPCSLGQSLLRNALLGATWLTPLPWSGRLFCGLWWLVDVSRAWNDPLGMRTLDHLANTVVTDARDPA
jgi:uncharacterized RDD family membrane protein YckC